MGLFGKKTETTPERKWVAVYKCRLCGAVFEVETDHLRFGGSEHATSAHNCKPGQMGITDLQGNRMKTEEDVVN